MAFRAFTIDHPRLFEVMYGRAFDSFDPTLAEREVGSAARHAIVRRVEQCVVAQALAGDPTDIAHAAMALAIGLATQETAGWLGGTAAARTHRWEPAIEALLTGYAPVA